MRKGLIAVVAVLTACASASPPPGGAEYKIPPKLVKVTPDTNAVNVKDENVSFQFDETINDRGTGEQEVDAYFLVSPSDGAPRVFWHRSRIDVRPRRGFRPNTAYTITLLPGLTDLRGNKMKTGATVVFSTGPTIPHDRITGVAFDWATERPAARAYMEAVTPDSIVYLAQSDSLGAFTIGPLTPGTYLVRAIIDANNNRVLDRNEAFDTLHVTVPQAAPLEMLAAIRDTLPPRLQPTVGVDTFKLTLTFDHLLDPRQTISPSAFKLVDADSAPIQIVDARSPRQQRTADSIAAKVAGDSARRADSLAGRKLAPVFVPAPQRAAPARAGVTPLVVPKPSLPAPFTTVTLTIARPLAPNASYRVTASGVKGITGLSTTSDRRFLTPKPPPPKPPAKDSTSAGKDSAKVVPPIRPPAAPSRPPASLR